MSKFLVGFSRDPSGHILEEDGVCRRLITEHGRPAYEALMNSGLYDALIKNNLLVRHREVALGESAGYKKIDPEQVPVISYPYEWCFAQFKEVALLTLGIQKYALRYGLSLKDATPFNVQFFGCDPVWIDTLSFEFFRNQPWVAYKQFCETQLAPLLLMSRGFVGINRYLRVEHEGLDLNDCSRWLPKSSYLNLGILLHIHLHARSQRKYDQRNPGKRSFSFSKFKQEAILDQLAGLVADLHLPKTRNSWSHYYDQGSAHYSAEALEQKQQFVETHLRRIQPKLLLDLGCNTGRFSIQAAHAGIYTIAIDRDSHCVEALFFEAKKNGAANLLPLVMNIGNPSPALGWGHCEKKSLLERFKPDLCLVLALVHHLRITCGIPFKFLAQFLAALAPNLLIEFMERDDPMVKGLMAGREDVFFDYSAGEFERAFEQFYRVKSKIVLGDSHRRLYALERIS